MDNLSGYTRSYTRAVAFGFKMTENNKYKKIVEKAVQLCLISDKDELITGNSYIEFSDRKIEVINPKNIKYTKDKKGYVFTEVKK